MLGDRTITERCFDALAAVEADRRVLVTEPGSIGELEPLARGAGWDIFVGNKGDVLDRFVQAARSFECDTIVRATGDNPLVSAVLANRLVRRHRERHSDYSGFVGAPVGTGVEVVSVSALERAWGSSPDAYEREHVSPHLYRNPGLFAIDRPEVSAECHYPQGRVTVDTQDDLAYLRSLWDAVYRGEPPEVEDLIPWLSQHPR